LPFFSPALGESCIVLTIVELIGLGLVPLSTVFNLCINDAEFGAVEHPAQGHAIHRSAIPVDNSPPAATKRVSTT